MLLSCGDALIDFLPSKTSDGREALTPVVGGSCLNVAIGVARLDVPAGFVGGISTDTFGMMIADHALGSAVDLRYATRSDHQATLAFARVTGTETQYAFYDAGTASRNWVYRRDAITLDDVECVHVGSTTLVNDKGAAEAQALIADARSRASISVDPNCRPNLVKDKDAYRARMASFCRQADIVKMSDVDFAYLFEGESYAARAATLLSDGASLVVVTRGDLGACAWSRSADDRGRGAGRTSRGYDRGRRQFSGRAIGGAASSRPNRAAAVAGDYRGGAQARGVICVQMCRLHLHAPGRRSAPQPRASRRFLVMCDHVAISEAVLVSAVTRFLQYATTGCRVV